MKLVSLLGLLLVGHVSAQVLTPADIETEKLVESIFGANKYQ